MIWFLFKLVNLVWLFAMLVAGPVNAADQISTAESAPVESTTELEKPTEDKTEELDTAKIIDSSHRAISENIIAISRRVDSFFSNERYLEESFGSYGCIKASTYFSEGGNIDTRASVCLKIDLPHTKKRWKLLFESDDRNDTQAVGEDDQRTVVAEVQDERNRSSSAVFRYVAEEELLKYVNFDIGVKTRTPLDPFTRLRYRRTWAPDPWLFRLTESLYYFKSIEGGFLSRFDIERRMGKDWYVRMTSEADYRDEQSQFNLAQNFGFYHRVGKGRALSWELVVIGASQPNPRVDFYVYKFRYRINLWREWFFVEVSPQLVHERENDFRSVAGILFAAEAVFGNY